MMLLLQRSACGSACGLACGRASALGILGVGLKCQAFTDALSGMFPRGAVAGTWAGPERN